MLIRATTKGVNFMENIYYSTFYAGEHIGDGDSLKDITKEMQEWWESEHCETGMANGEEITDEATVKKIMLEHTIELSYKHLQSDFAEHNTMCHGGSL